ncbi:MAG: uncharacterized protein KVP18_002157 [Porospora cf. gigantea A]|uniref:uncharacterized protein n=1 Tax=Porospora cf. gigantea A TaxID=2853593 RepID=UPI003559AE84|nr:MAG: hypothetical protein KVP18_002157 [Porospora cf. gigantea A]
MSEDALQCIHAVVFHGMCAVCGAEVREDRVKVGFLGKDTVTMVPALASSLETTKMAELLASRRLVLVLDLDHTIAHACPWPRTSLPVEVLAPRDERLHGEAGCPHYMTDCEERQRLDAIWEANVFRIVIEKEGCEGKMLRGYRSCWTQVPTTTTSNYALGYCLSSGTAARISNCTCIPLGSRNMP